MKSKFAVFIFLLSTFFFFSCEENNSEIKNTLDRKWNVTQIIDGMSQPKDYKKGDFTWTFDSGNKTIFIQNNVDIFNARDLPSFTNNQGGTYSFEILKENNTNYLIVGNREGTIKFNENVLTIDFGIAFDDVAYVFKR